MTPDAALDRLAFLIGLELMGSDARRRLRLALVRSPDFVGEPGFDVDALEQLDALLDGRRPPATLQDRMDLARAEEKRARAPFGEAFWLARVADLIGAGFDPQRAAQLIQSVRDGLAAPAAEKETANAS